MKRLKKRFQNLYWQQFLLTAGMVLLTLLLLGVSFYTLSYRYTMQEKRGEMQDRAELVAHMSAPYLVSAEQNEQPDDSLRNLAGVAARMSDVDFLICNRSGNVLLTSDERIVGQVVTLPDEVMQAILREHTIYEARTDLGGIYANKQFVVAVPVTENENSTTVIGMVVAVMETVELMEIWRSFIALFFMTAAIILLIAFVASSLTSMRQTQPIQEMVQATRAYAAGNFDIRMQDADRCDEIGELAASFNAMADSLAETERQRRDFIANISHELKTPMTTIAGYTDGILDGTIPPE